MRYNNEELQESQRVYLASRCDVDLVDFWEHMLKATRILLRTYIRRIGLHLPSDRFDEVVYDAVSRLVEWYLKHPEVTQPIPVAGRLNHEILFQLHSPHQKRADAASCELDPRFPSPEAEEVEELEPANFVVDLAASQEVNGKRILFDLFTSKYYATAIKHIDTYTPRTWMYRNAVQLRRIWEYTRKK